MLHASPSADDKSVQKKLLPVDTVVDVVGGVYPGMRATILGHTPKMYNVRLEGGKITVIKHGNVRPVSTLLKGSSKLETKESHQDLIEQELTKIYTSLDKITILLERMRLDKPVISPSSYKKRG